MTPAQAVQDRNRPLPNAYRSMKQREVIEALKKHTSLTDREYQCTLMYFDTPNYGFLSQEKIALELDMERAQVQRAISRAISKMEKEGLL